MFAQLPMHAGRAMVDMLEIWVKCAPGSRQFHLISVLPLPLDPDAVGNNISLIIRENNLHLLGNVSCTSSAR